MTSFPGARVIFNHPDGERSVLLQQSCFHVIPAAGGNPLLSTESLRKLGDFLDMTVTATDDGSYAFSQKRKRGRPRVPQPYRLYPGEHRTIDLLTHLRVHFKCPDLQLEMRDTGEVIVKRPS